MKQCQTCKENKPLAEFKPNKITNDKLHTICKKCEEAKKKYAETYFTHDPYYTFS